MSLDTENMASQLEQAYIEVWQTQMQDVPVLNPRLEVETVGFHIWQDFYLGVLVTPWFMNLVLLPIHQQNWAEQAVGSKFSYQFDAGNFEFILGEIENIGSLLSCSLFSPMFEFEDHAAAVATAQEVLKALFESENKETDQPQEWVASSEMIQEKAADQAKPQKLSRRELLRGAFLPPARQTTEQQQSDGN